MGKNKEKQKEHQQLKQFQYDINELFKDKYDVIYEQDEYVVLQKKNGKEKIIWNTEKEFSKKVKYNPFDKNLEKAITYCGHAHCYFKDNRKIQNIIYEVSHKETNNLSCRKVITLMRLCNDLDYYKELYGLLLRKSEKEKQKYVN